MRLPDLLNTLELTGHFVSIKENIPLTTPPIHSGTLSFVQGFHKSRLLATRNYDTGHNYTRNGATLGMIVLAETRNLRNFRYTKTSPDHTRRDKDGLQTLLTRRPRSMLVHFAACDRGPWYQ